MKIKRTVRMLTMLLLVACFAAGAVPVEAIRAAVVLAESAVSGGADGFGWTLEAAKKLAGDGVLSEGEWQYVLLPEQNYAVVVGHLQAGAADVTVPDRLGGADVVAIAGGTFDGHGKLMSVMLPGNVYAIEKGAFPRGVTLRGYNASYAQTYAVREGFAFEREAEFDFYSEVIDYADIREENFVRVSQYEVRMRALEAERLSVGRMFFLIDPANPYSVSYYTVASMTAGEDGFVTIRCQTPEVSAVLRSHSAVNELLVMDMDSLVLMNGAELVQGGYSRGSIGPETLSFSFSSKKLPKPIKADGFTLEFDGTTSMTYLATYRCDLSYREITLTETQKKNINVSLKYKTTQPGLVGSSEATSALKKQSEYAKTVATKSQDLVKRQSHTIRMGYGIVFSYAGIINVDIALGVRIDVGGKIEAEIRQEVVTTYHWDSASDDPTKSSEVIEDYCGLEIEGQMKVGIYAELSVRLFHIQAFSASVFIGVNVTASYKTIESHNWEDEIPLNMADCVYLKAESVIEATIKVVSQKVAGRTQTKPLAMYHFHGYDKVYLFDENGELVQEVPNKDRVHHEDKCPYDDKPVRVIYPWTPGGDTIAYETKEKYLKVQQVHLTLTDGAGNTIFDSTGNQQVSSEILHIDANLPDWAKQNRRYESVHTDRSLDADSKITKWPHTLKKGHALYIKATPLHTATFLYGDGTEIAKVYGEGDVFELPADETHQVRYWVRVRSRADKTVLEQIEKNPAGKYYEEMPRSDAVYFAVCENDVRLRFDPGNGTSRFDVFAAGVAGERVSAPQIFPTRPRYTFDGWCIIDENGQEQRVTFPLAITQQMISDRECVFYACWIPSGEITAEDLNECSVGVAPQNLPAGYFAPTADSEQYLIYKTSGSEAIVTGLSNDAPDNLNLVIPRETVVGGKTYTVTQIAEKAFDYENCLRSVDVPSTVDTIGSLAFAYCSNLKLIDLSTCTSLTDLPSYMAGNCSALEYVLIPKSVKTIWETCFVNCTSIKRASLNASLRASAFAGCTSLELVGMGAGVQYIQNGVFNGCTSLTELTIPDSLQSLGDNFIYGCTSLKTLTFAGAPREITANHLKIGANSALKKVVFESGIEELGANALKNGTYGHPNLTDITLPASLCNLGANAFEGTGIKRVELYGNNLTIDASTFRNCPQLEEVIVHSGSIGAFAFYDCNSLVSVTIGPGVRKIGASAFAMCDKLKNVVMEEGVLTIGSDAFAFCPQIEELVFPNSVYSYGGSMIQGCSGLKRLTVGGGCAELKITQSGSTYRSPFYIGAENQLEYLKIGEGVTALGDYVFMNTNKLGTGYTFKVKTIVLPNSLKKIGNYALSGMSVPEMYLQGVELGNNALASNCEMQTLTFESPLPKIEGPLQSPYIPRGEESLTIGSYAVANCTMLETIVIEEGYTTIAPYAFAGCTSLKKIVFPDSITSYGDHMLEGCVNLEEIVIGGGVKSLSLTRHDPHHGINLTPFYIGANAKLRRLEIREGVEEIGESVFANACGGSSNSSSYDRYYYFPNLETVILPESLRKIGDKAFQNSGLTSLEIPGGAASIGASAFSGCESLKTLTAECEGLIIGASAFAGAAALETAKLSGVANIGASAFSGAAKLRSVDLGEQLLTLGNQAFLNCTSLTKMTFPDSVTNYGSRALEGCVNIEELVIGGGAKSLSLTRHDPHRGISVTPFYIGANAKLRRIEIREGVEEIGESVFTNARGGSSVSSSYDQYYYFPNLETVILPESLRKIGDNAFKKSGLTSLEIPGGVTSIGTYAFLDNARLRTLHIAGDGLVMGASAFSGAAALEQVTIEEGVTNISVKAFCNASSLKKIAFPDSVTSYGDRMLEGCVNLEEIVIGGGVKSLKITRHDPHHGINLTPFYIGGNAKLRRLEIREGVEEIGESVFANACGGSSVSSSYDRYYYFPNLETVILPESLRKIGDKAFQNSGLTSLEIPGGAASIGASAFSGCESLKTLTAECEGLIIGASAFAGAAALETAKLSGVANIGASAFSGAAKLRSVDLGEQLLTLGNQAFLNCTSLTKMTFPDSVTNYGSRALEGCVNIEELVIGGGAKSLSLTRHDPHRGISVTPFYIGANAKLRRIEIREGVEEIGESVFTNARGGSSVSSSYDQYYYFPNLETVILPESLRKIGDNAFKKSGLTSLEIPGGVTSIGTYAFLDNARLRTLHIAGDGLVMGASAFSGAAALEQVTIEEGVTNISVKAFCNASSLKKIAFPDSVTSYGDRMLEGCVNLEEIVIGGGVKSLKITRHDPHHGINLTPFYIGGNAKLRRLEIREGVEEIGESVFANACGGSSNSSSHDRYYYFTNLETVILPESLQTIGARNISSWKALTALRLGANIASLTDVDTLSALTIYTDAFSQAAADFAAARGAAYAVRDEATYPQYTLRRVSSVGATIGALYLSDGATLVTRGMEGEAALLEAGYAVLTEEQVYYADPVAQIAQPQAAGYVFDGWYADPEHTIAWTGGRMPACDLTLYAKMLPISGVLYAVAFESAGAADDRLPEGYYLYAQDRACQGERIAPPVPQVEGRIFDRWYLDAACTQPFSPAFDTMPAEEWILYAGFVPQYDAVFAINLPQGAQDGAASLPEGFGIHAALTVTEGIFFTEPEEPVASGYVFTGWFEEPEFLHEWTGQKMPRGGVTVYGRMQRMRAGGQYAAADGGYQLRRYVTEQDEGSEVYLPAKVNGIPVVDIGSDAFAGDQITRLHLPENLTSFNEDAFDGMSNLTAFVIGANNKTFSTKDGVLYSKDQTVLYRYPRGKSLHSFTIPATVTEIAPYAFEDCRNLRSVVFPQGLERIGEGAFKGAAALKAVSLPESVAFLGAYAFEACGSLSSFTAYGLERIGEYAIPYHYGLQIAGPLGGGALRDYCMVTCDSGRVLIYDYNMYTVSLYVNGKLLSNMACEAGMPLPGHLEHAEMGDGTVIMQWFTDASLTQLWSFGENRMPQRTLSLYASSRPVFESVEETFVLGTQTDDAGNETQITQTGLRLTAYHGGDRDLVLPRAIGGVSVLGIADGFLSGAKDAVYSVDIGADVIDIADGALIGPQGYPFGGVVAADAGSYAYEWALEKGYTVRSSVYTLAFETGGAKISAKTSAAGAQIRLPEPVKTGAQFAGWYLDAAYKTAVSLDENGLFVMPSANTTLYAAWDGAGETYGFTYEETDGEITVTGCGEKISELTIPEAVNGVAVTAVADGAFAGHASLRRIALPAGVKTIGKGAFEGARIESADLGGALVIGAHAFDGCANLTEITMAAVREIGAYAFDGCIQLRTLNLPDTLMILSDGAFRGCTALGSVTLPKGVALVARDAFGDCVSLKQANLGSPLNVSPHAFDGCVSLTSITVSDGASAYSSVDGVLLSVDGSQIIRYPQGREEEIYEIPSGVTAIEERAFAGSKSLTQIVVPETLAIMGAGAFSGCDALEAFLLPEGAALAAIPESAFSGCSSLTHVKLTPGVTAIASNAFFGCSALEQVEIPAETTQIASSAFGMSDNLLFLGVTGSAAHRYAKEHGYLFSDPDVPLVNALTISAETNVLKRGDTLKLTLTSEPQEALENANITWLSSNEAVAIVMDGTLRAIGGGTATVTARAENGVSADFEVEVQVDALSVALEPIALLARGESVKAETTVLPESATNQVCTFASGDETVFTVDENGLVTAVGPGTATLTATTHNGLTAQIEVQVFNAVEAIEIIVPDTPLYAVKGLNTLSLTINVLPEDASDPTYVLTSSDPQVAGVDAQGLVQAVCPGEVVITAAAQDARGKTAQAVVQVLARDISQLTLEQMEPIVYDAAAHVPQIVLEMDGMMLSQGTDYRIDIAEAIDAGEYPYTVTGIGLYGGTLEGTLVITPAQPQITCAVGAVHRSGVPLPPVNVVPAVPYTVQLERAVAGGEYAPLDAFDHEPGDYRMTVTIEETANYGAAQWSAAFTVMADWLIGSCGAVTLAPGQSAQLETVQLPAELPAEALTFESSNTSAVRVTADGRMTAAAEGSALITARVADGAAMTVCEVTVRAMDRQMSLPGLLRNIAEEAFAYNSDVEVLVLGERMESIGRCAFAGMTDLMQVHLPASVSTIAPDAFEGNAQMVILCPQGSAAQAFAQEAGIAYLLE